MVAHSAVPFTTACDPVEVPVNGCSKAETVKLTLQKCQALEKDIHSELLIVIVESQEDASKDVDTPTTPTPFQLPPEVATYDKAMADGVLSEMIEARSYEGKLGSSVTGRIPPSANKATRYVSLVGLGDIAKLTANMAANQLASEVANIITAYKPKSVSVYVAPKLTHNRLEAMVTGVLLQCSPDNRFRSMKHKIVKEPPVAELTVYTGPHCPSVEKIDMERAKAMASAIYFSQQLVDAPANYVNPCTLANSAVAMAKNNNLEVRILEKEEIEALGMGLYLGVAKGSMFPPKFIHATYKGAKAASGEMKKLAFIGKGICFDSGGYNIKNTACQIELMKFDMGGAAAVLGTALAIGKLRPVGVEVHFIVAACENMVSDRAYRPGDILKASNGKFVEIGNTDAEGRLTLGDALVYAENLGVDEIVDIATLTGACVIALGPKYAGLFSSHDKLANDILSSATEAGELMWHLPVVAEYRDLLDSKCADINNCSFGGKGGAITAAVFLKEFVKKTPWAHIDIAGPAWDTKEGRGTGYGVRTLVQHVLDQAN